MSTRCWTSSGSGLPENPIVILAVDPQTSSTVYLGVEDLVEVQQMQIGYQLRSADGAPVTGEIYHTINKLTGERGERVLAGF